MSAFPPFQVDDIVRAYRMYREMIRHPHLLGEIRRFFLSMLQSAGLATEGDIRRQVLEHLESDGIKGGEESLDDYVDAFIDLLFAHNFGDEELRNCINLARKKDAFHDLNRVVNTEGVTSIEIKRALKEFLAIPDDLELSPEQSEGVRVELLSHFISNQIPFVSLAKKHFSIGDIDEVIDHSYWNRRRAGRIGGKAAGMLLAYKILCPRLQETDPGLMELLAVPESYYFNSGILMDFIDYNRLYILFTQKYKTPETVAEEYGKIVELFRKAHFPPDVVKDFRKFLQEVGEIPLILRSSSLLEDTLGHIFSGKYDSVFIANHGDIEDRLREFIGGLKAVFMSTFSPSPILYRRDHNLIDFDERMSVLVQKVVGRRFGKFFFPFAAGVAVSRNPHQWTPRIRKEDGLVRLVMGLGTRAVDRVGPDYPRMVPLSHPSLRPEVSVSQIRKYSQKWIDVLNLKARRLESVSYLDLFGEVDYPEIFHAFSMEQEEHLSPPLFKGGRIDLQKSCITFDNFLGKTSFVPLMKRALQVLERAYGYPVDVEFAWEDGKLYILQCRSQAIRDDTLKVVLPESVPEDQVLFTSGSGASNGVVRNIEYIVYIDPRAYAKIATFEDRMKIARTVGKINRALEGKRYALFGPVRWGSSDVNQGVKVAYEDINGTLILGEIAFERHGLTPEVSYGTHFFSDLIEADIIPLAIYPDQPGVIFRETFFLSSMNVLTAVAPDLEPLSALARVIHVPSSTSGRYLHVYQDGQKQRGIGFFDFPYKEA